MCPPYRTAVVHRALGGFPWLPVIFALLAGCTFENLAEEREFVHGPTNIHAATGNGGLSAAFSESATSPSAMAQR